MVRSSLFACGILLAACNPLPAQSTPAYNLLPDNTQAVVWIPDSQQLEEQWTQTQLSKMLDDEAVAPFFEAQRKEIQERFMEAGWRLNVKPKDVLAFATGQLAFAWTNKDDAPLKPYALALIADVENKAAVNAKMMQTIEEQLDPKKTKKKELKHGSTKITKYSLPPRAGELMTQDSYFAIVEGLLLVADDEPLIKQMIDRAGNPDQQGTLAADAVFTKGRELANISGEGQLEYFARPLGFARVIRSIGGKRSKSSADILAVLENQGFSSIKCICGEVSLGKPDLDIFQHGYVYANRPLPRSAGVLDFPNEVAREVPNFVGENISTFLAINWNAEEAFWKTAGLVDELAGTEGVFDEVIEGIKKDPNGPRIDIRVDVLPLLTNDIFSISDNKEGEADVDSRRNLIALKISDSDAMSEVLNKAMKGEPDAEKVEFDGVEIWQVVHRDEDEFSTDGFDDFGDFGDEIAEEDEPEPWLSNWAITVHDGYLMFASHVELIQDAISQARLTTTSPFTETNAYARVTAALADLAQIFGQEDASAWRVLIPEKAFRVQYELFRAGKIRQSKSMLASILDRLLQNDSEMQDKEQKISGRELPEFEAISKYLQPGGMVSRTTPDGWEFGSLLLSETGHMDVLKTPSGDSADSATFGTARIVDQKSRLDR